jgi:hypothetical protein
MTDLMKDFTEIDTVALGNMREAERTGEGVNLPFPVLNVFVMNGDARQKAAGTICPMLYFGGWATDNDKLAEMLLDGKAQTDLDKWPAFEGAGDKGSWNGRASRTVTAAIVASRARWIGMDGKAGPHFDREKGLTRQHVQWLSLLYNASKPWGYAVLTAKGYQAQNVAQAIKEWGAAIQPYRAALNAASLPLSAFAITLGTQGPEPKFTPVGKTATSKITPIEAVIPPDLSAERVSQRFIGAANVRANSERFAQAAEWLAAWGKGRAEAKPNPLEEVPADDFAF